MITALSFISSQIIALILLEASFCARVRTDMFFWQEDEVDEIDSIGGAHANTRHHIEGQ